MKVDTYIQWNSMMYETFFAEEPRAVDWIQRDVAGIPILLNYAYQQSFRYRPCFSNQNYLDYLKKVVRYAIVDVKTDFIHFDNFDLNAEPDSCHCLACKEGFRKRLKTKYSGAQLRERFGFERVDFVNPPQWNRDNPAGGMQIICKRLANAPVNSVRSVMDSSYGRRVWSWSSSTQPPRDSASGCFVPQERDGAKRVLSQSWNGFEHSGPASEEAVW